MSKNLYSDPRHTLRALLNANFPPHSHRLITEAAAFLLKDPRQRISRLAEFASWLHLQGKTVETRDRTDMIMIRMIAALEAQGWDSVVMDLHLTTVEGQQFHTPGKERWPNRESYRWVVSACYRYVGSTDELSLRYAKDLMEACMGSYLEAHLNPHEEATAIRLSRKTSFVHTALALSFERIPGSEAVLKGWLERLVAMTPHDLAAMETLIDCLRLLQSFAGKAKWRLESYLDGSEPTQADQEAAQRQRYSPGAEIVHLRFYARHVTIVRKVIQTEAHEQAVWQAEAEKTTAWLWENAERLTLEARRKLGELRGNPRWLVRPRWLDRIEIRVPLLEGVGIRSVAFGIEGCAFPDAKVRVSVEKDRSYLYVYDTTVDQVQEMDRRAVDTGRLEGAQDILRFALWLVTVDALHGIVVNDRSAKKKRKADGDAGKDDGQPPGPVIRRAHRRVLHEGHKASDAALALMQEAFRCTFGPGITFVQAVKPDGDNAAERSAAPIATYRHADLLALLPKPADV